jgi:outer membrane protein TolC
LIPTISAQAFVGGLGGGPGGSTDNFGDSQDYGVFLGWRIGPGGLFDSSRVKAADARLKGAKLTADRIRDEIIQQVVESRTRAQSLTDQLSTARANLATSAEALRLTEQRKESAVSVVLEVIQAQQDLARARYDYITTVAEYNKAQYALSRALGIIGQTGVAR